MVVRLRELPGGSADPKAVVSSECVSPRLRVVKESVRHVSLQNATMRLDLCDREGKYSNGFCHW